MIIIYVRRAIQDYLRHLSAGFASIILRVIFAASYWYTVHVKSRIGFDFVGGFSYFYRNFFGVWIFLF